MPRGITKSGTSGTATASGGTVAVHVTGLPNYFVLTKIKVTPSVGGTYDVEIFKKDTLGAGDLMAKWKAVTGNLYDPQDESSGTPAEMLPSHFAVVYEDADGTGELHIKFTNNHTVDQTFSWETVTEESLVFDSMGVLVFNESGADQDIRIESDTNVNHFISDAGLHSGAGGFGIGGAPSASAYWYWNFPALTAGANLNFLKVAVGNAATLTIPAGTADLVTSLFVDEPNIAATGTVTRAATVYISDAPTEGVSNYSLLVNAGATNLQGSLQCDSIVNDTGLAHGTYTPTLTGVANVDGTTAILSHYLRVGNEVFVSGRLAVDPTAASTSTEVGISLPVASNFAAQTDCAGGGTSDDSTIVEMGRIVADTTNDRASFIFNSATAANHGMNFWFVYKVI
jgi:hypothetical protein